MSDQFLAEIRLFAGNFAPSGWATCNGQLLPISQNTALFSLIGTYYGGNGTSNFALPDLSGSVPLQQGQGAGLSQRVLGETGGVQAVDLILAEMPQHRHPVSARVGPGSSGSPGNGIWAQATYSKAAQNIYSTAAPNTAMSPAAIQPNGGGQPHNNMPPYLCLTYIISLTGIFPQRP